MKLVILAFALSLSLAAKSADCRTANKELRADIDALGAFMESGARVIKNKSSDPKEMVKETIEDLEGYHFNWNAKSVPEWGEYDAGIVTRKGAYNEILGSAETWYSEDSDGKSKMKEIQKATFQALSHEGIIYGYNTGEQGWGGSPATNILFLNPECKTTMILFLGITHD